MGKAKPHKVWVDNLIYLGVAFLAVAACLAFVALKINFFPDLEFPVKGAWATTMTLLLAGYTLRHFRRSWKLTRFWASFLAFMALHVAVLVFLLQHGLSLFFFWLIGPEFLVIAIAIHAIVDDTTT